MTLRRMRANSANSTVQCAAGLIVSEFRLHGRISVSGLKFSDSDLKAFYGLWTVKCDFVAALTIYKCKKYSISIVRTVFNVSDLGNSAALVFDSSSKAAHILNTSPPCWQMKWYKDLLRPMPAILHAVAPQVLLRRERVRTR